MQDLISKLTGELNIDATQAEGGLGAIFKMAQDKLDGDTFGQLTSALPAVTQMIGKAPQEGGGLGGMIGSALGSMGMDNLGQLGALAGQFKSLGLDADMISKFAPIVTDYLKANGGGIAEKIIAEIF